MSRAGWRSPVPGVKPGTPFGATSTLWSSGRHTGQDFPCPTGTTVHAVAGGRVVYAGNTHGPYGIQVKVQHRPGLQSWYCHLSATSVARGQRVEQGTPLGRSGATGHVTGPHLHLEARLNGIAVDPMPYINGTRDPGPVRAGGKGNAWGDSPFIADLMGDPPGRPHRHAPAVAGTASPVAYTPAGAGAAAGVLGGPLAQLLALPFTDLRGMVLTGLFVSAGVGLVVIGAARLAKPAVDAVQDKAEQAAKLAAELDPETAPLAAAM